MTLMWKNYWTPATLNDALRLLDRFQGAARLIAGGTDLLIELDRGVRRVEQVIDISRLPDLDAITQDNDGTIHLGPLVTHNDVVASAVCVAQAFPLAQACREVGAPQIRNRATVAGNLITASPANDTITPLMALDAVLTLRSVHGERQVPLSEFYTGVRKTVMQPNEMLVEITFRGLKTNMRGCYLKLGLRRAQAISVVNCAILAAIESSGDLVIEPLTHWSNHPISHVRIALGAVAPTIVRVASAEAYLVGKALTAEVIAEAARLAAQSVKPISDVRASAEYRRDMVEVLVRRALTQVAAGVERDGWGEQPVLLELGDLAIEPSGHLVNDSMTQSPNDSMPRPPDGSITTSINGQPHTLSDPAAQHKTLLRLLREDCNLVGTKEGCAEGECGACTVLLDGKAVMACLVPAGRADGAAIVTVEGVADVARGAWSVERDDAPDAPDTPRPTLHALQQAFIDCGAVQCGYCTPGFIMSGAALLAEHAHPSEAQIKEGFSGNLCRCTGYYKIIEAVQRAQTQLQLSPT